MNSSETIHLNFLPVDGEIPNFTVYVRALSSIQESKPSQELKRYNLPVATGDQTEWNPFWVSIDPLEGFEPRELVASDNIHLTKWLLLQALKRQASSPASDFSLGDKIHESMEITMATYKEGEDVFAIEPYYLKESDSFGVIVDFRFKKNPGIPFSRLVQQRSMSLNRQFKRNFDFHIDKLARLRDYIGKTHSLLNQLPLPGATSTISFVSEFVPLTPEFLSPRTYKFANNQINQSQYEGVKRHGPFAVPEHTTKLIFAFLSENRQSAVRFANSVSGRTNLGSFSGFEPVFRTALEIDPKPVILASFEETEIRRVLQRVQADDPPPLAVFILPDRDEDRYLSIKSLFTAAGLPTQMCTTSLLNSDNDLKWSVANLALQVFCKSGGQPWRVNAPNADGLVIGISQSHKIGTDGKIDRFFAFSVLTDSGGVFQRVRVLADSPDHSKYVESLQQTLYAELKDASSDYQRVSVHASFKLKMDEMEAIQNTVQSVAGGSSCSFSVLKINQHTRFFGTNPAVTSLVPYEGSLVRLSASEFLIWFEGFARDRKTTSKAYPGPTHIQVLWTSENNKASHTDLIQDLMNLSGANWRGFNARSSPISVYYCHLVAEMVHDFQARGLQLPSVEGLRPWFL